MKRKKVLSMFLAAVLAFSGVSGLATERVHAEEIVIATRPADGVTEDQPFAPGTGGSNLFRIPCLVTMDDGTIIAGCDARWTTSLDGGGLDTIISRSSDNGATWNYTFANYLGDNGNVANYGSTCFIDPAIATDGKTIYMIADLFPAGYALNGAHHSPVAGQNGLDADGNLRLSDDNRTSYNFTLKKKVGGTEEDYYEVKDAQGNTVAGYTIDAYFNIKGNGVDTNLFIDNSPYKAYPTDYLYMTSSEDNGATWSIPTLLNLKDEDEQVLLVGPGNGIVASNGRIIFTAYEHTSGNEKTTAIYSDDGGKTWVRGESVANASSEATVAEVNGKLYMFTRGHSNGQAGAYWISDNWGQSWSQKYTPTVQYNGRCQLSVIAYSENINGKPALLLAAPSSTSGREDGKIYICLVKEDGTLEFPYEFVINKGYYAYSCLDELKNGNIGLLYESAGAGITYREITKDEIFKDVFVGNIWVEDNGDYAQRSYDMKAGATKTLQVKNSSEGKVQVTSNNEAVQVSLSGETLMITTSPAVKTMEAAELTLTDGEDTTTIQINVVAADNYKIIDLRMGDSVTFTDETGNHVDSEKEGLDTKIAEVSLEARVIAGGLRVQKATAEKTFDGEKINIADCLYTFQAVEGSANTYTISGTTAAGEKAYMKYGSSATIPNERNSANITIAKHASDNTFSFHNGSAYLYFHKADSLRYNRNSTIHENCYFELYVPSESAGNDAVIPGYQQVTALDQLQAGSSYLIVSQGTNGKRYVLHPALTSTTYDHVAEVAGVEPDTHHTVITVEGVTEGITSAVIGDTTYYVHVKNDEKVLRLEPGAETILAGKLYAQEEGQTVLDITKNTNRGPYGAVSEVTDGKYLIGTSSHAVINEDSGLTGPSGLAMKSVNFAKGDHSKYMWNVTKVDGGYTVQDADGKYINFSGNNVTLSTTAQTLSIGSKTNNGFSLSAGGAYLNNWSNTNDRAAAYGSDNNTWYFYQPLESIIVTAKNVGSTKITLGGTNYRIVVGEELNNQEIQAAKEALNTVITEAEGKQEKDYTAESWNAFTTIFNEVKGTFAKENATKEELVAAKQNLENAIKALVLATSQPGDQPSTPDQPGTGDNTGNQEKPGTGDNTGNQEKPGTGDNTGNQEKPGTGDNTGNQDQPGTESETVKVGTTFVSGAYKYKVTAKSTVSFIGLANAKTKKVTIPATVSYNGTTYKITDIANNALKNKQVTSVGIGKNVKTIGTSAFEGCKKLTKVTIGAGVTKIGDKAFKGCKVLKSITIPKKVTSIGKEAFRNCSKLASIKISATKLKTVGKNAFKGIKSNAKIKVPAKQLKSYKKLLSKKGQSSKVKITK